MYFHDALCVMIENVNITQPPSFLKITTLLNAPLAIYKLKQQHEESMFEKKHFMKQLFTHVCMLT